MRALLPVQYTIGIVGTGEDPDNPDMSGFAMAYRHAEAYRRLENCQLVACADVVPENADAFADRYGLESDRVYGGHQSMLDDAAPDVVSVTVPPAAHAEIVVDCVRADVSAVHCEKPMSLTWGESRLMAQEADRRDVNLTFNHQRRFAPQWRRAKELLDDGEIGDLARVETAPPNLYDWGTHALDLCNFYNDEHPPEWVIGQVDYREEDVWFGAHNENQALAQWTYANGVDGVATTGFGKDAVGAVNRLVGTDGEIEVGVHDGPDLRVRRTGKADWETIECEAGDAGDIALAIEDVVRALEDGTESELCARNALNATEIIFGAYESARRRGRVDCPLTVEDNPLESMVESGQLTPRPGDGE